MTMFKLLDWNAPWFRQSADGGLDYTTYSRALLDVRSNLNLPERPPRPAQDQPADPSAPTTSLDTAIFIGLMAVARNVTITFTKTKSNTDRASAELMFHGDKLMIEGPAEAELPAMAKCTDCAMAMTRERIGEIVAQNVEPDRFMLDAMGMHANEFPAWHAFARLVIVSANALCLPLKSMFAIARPSQLVDGAKRPLLKRPPALPLPGHPSYPGGHAMQCASVARLLEGAMKLGANSELTVLAQRIAHNRVIAGLHYDKDSADGVKLGQWFADAFMKWLLEHQPAVRDAAGDAAKLRALPALPALLAAANAEMPFFPQAK